MNAQTTARFGNFVSSVRSRLAPIATQLPVTSGMYSKPIPPVPAPLPSVAPSPVAPSPVAPVPLPSAAPVAPVAPVPLPSAAPVAPVPVACPPTGATGLSAQVREKYKKALASIANYFKMGYISPRFVYKGKLYTALRPYVSTTSAGMPYINESRLLKALRVKALATPDIVGTINMFMTDAVKQYIVHSMSAVNQVLAEKVAEADKAFDVAALEKLVLDFAAQLNRSDAFIQEWERPRTETIYREVTEPLFHNDAPKYPEVGPMDPAAMLAAVNGTGAPLPFLSMSLDGSKGGGGRQKKRRGGTTRKKKGGSRTRVRKHRRRT
jgi:hypothetical protein